MVQDDAWETAWEIARESLKWVLLLLYQQKISRTFSCNFSLYTHTISQARSYEHCHANRWLMRKTHFAKHALVLFRVAVCMRGFALLLCVFHICSTETFQHRLQRSLAIVVFMCASFLCPKLRSCFVSESFFDSIWSPLRCRLNSSLLNNDVLMHSHNAERGLRKKSHIRLWHQGWPWD